MLSRYCETSGGREHLRCAALGAVVDVRSASTRSCTAAAVRERREKFVRDCARGARLIASDGRHGQVLLLAQSRSGGLTCAIGNAD